MGCMLRFCIPEWNDDHSERCSEKTPEHSATPPPQSPWNGLGGNAVRFFHFVFFVSGSASSVVFHRSSLLRSLFGKIFGGNAVRF